MSLAKLSGMYLNGGGCFSKASRVADLYSYNLNYFVWKVRRIQLGTS